VVQLTAHRPIKVVIEYSINYALRHLVVILQLIMHLFIAAAMDMLILKGTIFYLIIILLIVAAMKC